MYSMQLCRPSLRLPSRRAIMSLRKQGQQQNLVWVTQARYYIVHSVSASIAYFLKKDSTRSRITIWILAHCRSQESFILWTGIVASSLQNCLWKRCALRNFIRLLCLQAVVAFAVEQLGQIYPKSGSRPDLVRRSFILLQEIRSKVYACFC